MAVLPFNIPGFNPKVTPPTVKFPAGATDCHAHVFGPQSQFPYTPGAAYIAPDATPHDYARMLTTIGCQRAVLVQPSVYGADNSCMVAAMTSGVFNFRGIAVVEPNVTDKELQTLHDAGVRGIRINLASETEGLKFSDGERLAPRLKAMGWHLQFFLDLEKMPAAEAQLASLNINIVIDHFAKCLAANGVDAGGMGGPGYGMNFPASQIGFIGPDGMQVHWDVTEFGGFDSEPLVTPGRYDFAQGAIYRLKLTDIPGQEGLELYPTLEVAPVTPRTDAFLAHNAIPFQLTDEDLDQVTSGNFVTKVVYLPDPEYQELAVAGVETLVSTRLDPGCDPVVEADRRGSILAIIRIGNQIAKCWTKSKGPSGKPSISSWAISRIRSSMAATRFGLNALSTSVR